MSNYIKTNWQDGDIITASKMNNIETGVKNIDDNVEQISADVVQLQGDLSDLSETVDGMSGGGSVPELVDELTQLKADLTAVETDIETGNLTAGTAKQLLSDNGMTDKSPYLFRAMPTGAGDREEPVIVGGSVVWNQLSDPSAYTASVNASVSTTGNVTEVTLSGSSGYRGITICKKMVVGHKYLFMTNSFASTLSGQVPHLGGGINYGGNDYATFAVSTSPVNIMFTASTENLCLSGWPSGTPVWTFDSILITDLTTAFPTAVADYVYSLESATAGAGIAWLRKYGFFTKDYYPYTEPTFKHVEGLAAHKMVGFNQWDEVWEQGTFNTTTGANIAGTGQIRAKNLIPILPNTAYFWKCPYFAWFIFYDANKNVIYPTGTGGDGRSGNSVSFLANTPFRTPADAWYCRFYVGSSYGGTYKNNICFHFYLNSGRDMEYEPYKSHTYPLDTDVVLRGIPKLDSANNLYFDGDRYLPDGTVERRYGVVDLGDVSWTYANGVFYSPNAYGTSQDALCSKYVVVKVTTSAEMPDKSIRVYSNRIYVKDSTYTDVATFKTAMSGVLLVYELATPTTETADPYAPLQLADPYGTEEWVLDDEAFPMPVGQETFYPENLRAKIEGLPWNFANLIAPTEVSNVATRAYTTGQLFIVDNVLYQATTSIASGGTITPGTNCTATTLAEVISAL